MLCGLRMSQDIVQEKIDQTYQNYQSAVGITDDVQVFGDDWTHDLHLHRVTERTWKAGFKLNLDKCKSKSCSFFGNIYTLQGVKPDPKNTQASKKMQEPPTKQERNSLNGMLNYQNQFTSASISDFRNLLKKDVLFHWTNNYEKDFWELNNSISSDACFQYYNPSKPVPLQVDASQRWLATVLIQKDSG